MYDCKLMELGERSLWSGWAAGRSFFVVEGGGRMADDGRRGDGCRLAPGFVGGWLLGCRNSAKTASKILKLASEAAQTVRIFEATQISASQESAPLLQSPSTGSTRLTGWLFRAVGECGGSGDRIRAVGECGCLGGWIRAVGEGGCLEGWIRVRLSGASGVG